MFTPTRRWTEVYSPGRPFLKMHGLRNHFAIVDARAAPYRPPAQDIVRACDPQVGVGADQLLVIEPPSPRGAAEGAYAFMRIYNIDGREVEACGNATRCVAYLLLEESGRDALSIETLAGVLACKRAGDLCVSVNMGRITMEWDRIPMARATDTLHAAMESGPLRDAVVLNIGNPHAVFFVESLNDVDMPRFAPPIQKHPLFPEGVNVGAVEVIGEAAIRLAVWERPGMLTQACGSGACVSAYAARARNLIKARRITVDMPAGRVEVQLNNDDTATMTGPVAFCYQGRM